MKKLLITVLLLASFNASAEKVFTNVFGQSVYLDVPTVFSTLPTVKLSGGVSVLTVPVLDFFGVRSNGEVLLYPDGHYTYSIKQWDCAKLGLIDNADLKAACELK